ncbi:MAG: chemotaxis protein CheW [Pseudolabrys sp.]|jgi:purine-binding chemotaxis protein CheW
MTQTETPDFDHHIVAASAVSGMESGANGQAAGHITEFISFAIGNDQYGVDIMAVREIKGWAAITHLPKQPDYVRGVLNLRGAIVPIVDLRCRFGQGLTETSPLHIVIIVQIGDRQVGLIGDRVLDIVSVSSDQIQPVPHTGNTRSASFLAGLVSNDDVMIALIDLPNLLAGRDGIDIKTIVLDA